MRTDVWTIDAVDAEDALIRGLQMIMAHGEYEESRAGPVLVAPCPVVTVTRSPMNRVVLAPWRDANPFFHLVEAAWMLAGRDDAASLTPYVKRFADFAEPEDGRVHGAYGHRWRTVFGVDQLKVVTEKLRASPLDRQCVVAMWDADINECDDLTGDWRDRPCNTHIYLRQRQLSGGHILDMTVCCRSNDLLWGAHGANVVHFSFLLEYLASAVGSQVGVLRQFSNNYHVYTKELDRLRLKEDFLTRSDPPPDPQPMGSALDVDADMLLLWPAIELVHEEKQRTVPLLASPFAATVYAAVVAHSYHRQGRTTMACHVVQHHMLLPDWRRACLEWLNRRAVP